MVVDPTKLSVLGVELRAEFEIVSVTVKVVVGFMAPGAEMVR